MPTCYKCGGPLKKTQAVLKGTVLGRTFELVVPAEFCRECGEEFFEAEAIRAFDMFVAQGLAVDGPLTGEALRHMRKALGMPAVQAAELLGVTPETLSRWERGKRPPNPRMIVLFGAIVRDTIAGESTTLDNLQRAAAA